MQHDPSEPVANLMLVGQILLGIWITALGSSAGSFLNVVIFRWPAGRSVVNPGSRCPNCHNRVRWYDNIPVLNWFWLRGKCRDCGLPISFRYPAIEALIGSIFLGLYLLYVVYLGVTLPAGWVQRSHSEMMYYLLRLLAFHATFFTVSVAAVMIRFDGHRIPWELAVCGCLVGLVMLTVWPELHPVPVYKAWKLSRYIEGSVNGGLGLLVGGLAGLALFGKTKNSVLDGAESLRGCECRWFEFGLGGLFFGFQSVFIVFTVVACGCVLQSVLGRFFSVVRRWPSRAWIPIAYGILLLSWRWVAKISPLLWGE